MLKELILVISRSGKFVRKTYTYVADKMEWDPKSINFGKIPFNTPTCKTITFTNLRDDAPLNILELKTKYFPETFTFSPSTLTIDPGQSAQVEVCATISKLRKSVSIL